LDLDAVRRRLPTVTLLAFITHPRALALTIRGDLSENPHVQSEDSDAELRVACFAELRRLSAAFGRDIPYRGGLAGGFQFAGNRVPFLTPAKGIFRSRYQRGPAALSINTSVNSPYADRATADGYVYAYRRDPDGEADNRALQAAHELRTPIVYFYGTRPRYYTPLFPWFVDENDPIEREVHVTPGQVIAFDTGLRAEPLDSPIERQYRFRESRVRVHQARFRGAVLPAYRERCAICRLKEPQLLDAAHIIGDLEDRGDPVISNGLSLCSIHHRAFDEDLVGIAPDLQVHVSRRLLDDEDGPMLDLLKGFHGTTIEAPEKKLWRPDPERLAVRFDRFRDAA